jgi:hypothetical protein
MALKRPKQSKAVAPYKAKEMLDLAPLSKKTADKFRDAMRQAGSKARYTGSPYHRSSSKEGPVAQRVGLTSRCPQVGRIWRPRGCFVSRSRKGEFRRSGNRASRDTFGTWTVTSYMRQGLQIAEMASIMAIR